MPRITVGVLVALALVAVAAAGETVVDYARIKAAPCTDICTRKAIHLLLPDDAIPERGVMITEAGEFAHGGYWKIVDFEKSRATVLSTEYKTDQSGHLLNWSIGSRVDHVLDAAQLSTFIHIANELWLGHQAKGRLADLYPMCPGATAELYLLDGDRALTSFASCPFADTRSYEGKLDAWFDATVH